MGAAAVLAWQSAHDSVATLAAFSGFEAWWQTSHLMPRPFECSSCLNFTPPIGLPVRTIVSFGVFAWANAGTDTAMSTANPRITAKIA